MVAADGAPTVALGCGLDLNSVQISHRFSCQDREPAMGLTSSTVVPLRAVQCTLYAVPGSVKAAHIRVVIVLVQVLREAQGTNHDTKTQREAIPHKVEDTSTGGMVRKPPLLSMECEIHFIMNIFIFNI